MLVVGMVRIARVEEVELGIVDLILLDPVLKLLAVTGHEPSGLVNDVSNLRNWKKLLVGYIEYLRM